jgi:hypothetical protein
VSFVLSLRFKRPRPHGKKAGRAQDVVNGAGQLQRAAQLAALAVMSDKLGSLYQAVLL